ncbi:Preprotein translocase SecA subunit [Planctomycetales bacterium 10988]|nr:Preprotein translocase SecA subunit [Planctomycetales bacterium 10988]
MDTNQSKEMESTQGMEFLENAWEAINVFFANIARGVEFVVGKIFGSSNARMIKQLEPRVERVNELEPNYVDLSDDELKEQTNLFRERLKQGETLDDIMEEAFAVCREAGKRFLGMRHYDVQLLGGMVLHKGGIAEMVTGEGKTLVATLPAYLNAIEGKGVHVVTVNDYLARRDMEWMGPLFIGLGLTVGAIQANMSKAERQRVYDCDITYGTNNEFGFDYLRDNMCQAARGDDDFPKPYQQVQRGLNFAVIDEVDNILIDEARTPLIIAGPAHDDITKYPKADKIARQLSKDKHFEVKEKERTVVLTDEGVREAERLAGVESFYTPGNMEWPHLIDNALKAHYLHKRDVNYMVKDGQVVIVDEFTGRPMEGRQWSDGLHQAVEAKENVKIKEENQTLATVTLQNFFRLYNKLGGMTGTAKTEEGEFWKIYEMEVFTIPTNRGLQRVGYPDLVFASEKGKFRAIVEDIERLNKWDIVQYKDDGEKELVGSIKEETDEAVTILPHQAKKKITIPKDKIVYVSYKGRPVLVGTTSIEKSERISSQLERKGIPHQVLNAKHHEREAEIIAQAGRLNAVTIATNMAGRGTDIILGGNPETMAWAQLQHTYPTRLDVPQEEWDALVDEIEQRENMKEAGREVAKRGGLHVIGTERHESRRIDLQLVGRSGRQGDPGSSRFYLSLEDDLMRIFAQDWVRRFLTRFGWDEEEAIESKMVTRRIEAAQKKVEDVNFERRKSLLEYDEVMDEQRKRVYNYRQEILEGADCRDLIMQMIEKQISQAVDQCTDRDYSCETFAAFAAQRLGLPTDSLRPRDFRGMNFDDAKTYAHDQAERQAESHVLEAIEQSLPETDDTSEWKWLALTNEMNRRFGTNLRDKDLKKYKGETYEIRADISEMLIERAREAVHRIDLSDGEQYLDENWGIRSLLEFVKDRYGVEVPQEEAHDLNPEELKELLTEKAQAAYLLHEAKFPIIAAFARYSSQDSSGSKRFDREGLAEWASQRFETEVSVDDLKNKQRDELFETLVGYSTAFQTKGRALGEELEAKIDQLTKKADMDELAEDFAKEEDLESLIDWMDDHTDYTPEMETLKKWKATELRYRLMRELDDTIRPEMRRMERKVVLDMLDMNWKEHLLTMDYLRSSVAFRGYGQVDPKIEYKREGMKAFDAMWDSFRGQVIHLAFRMEKIDERLVRSVWQEAEARHDEAGPATQVAQKAPAEPATSHTESGPEGENSQGGGSKAKPIRKVYSNVRRNDKCPCGSGKKFKSCCLRRIQQGQPPLWEKSA